jgi:hypothetical protein
VSVVQAIATATTTTTPTTTATTTPTVAPNGASGATDVSPATLQTTVGPGSHATYTHTISNLGGGADTKDVLAVSAHGWTITLLQSDGVTPLVDTNGDGFVDTGKLASGAGRTIVVKVDVPSSAALATTDKLVVTAWSTGVRGKSGADQATDTTTVASSVKLSISTSTLAFGAVSPGGDVDPSAANVSSVPDPSGASYVRGAADGHGAVRVTVTSNGTWTGSCWADENSGTASSVRVSEGRLQWSLTGSGTWAPVQTQADPACFTTRPVGSTTYGFDYRLRFNWTDDPGTVSTALHFSVSP